MAARAAATRTASRQQVGLKFPCGHVAGDRAVAGRTRATATAVWVACPRCNVIALVIDRTTEAHVCLIGTIFSLLYRRG